MIRGRDPNTPRTKRREAARFGLSTLWALATAMLLAGPASAQRTGAVHQTAGYGLKMLVDMRWVDSAGYRPVSIEIIPSAPPPGDRTLTVELRCQYPYGERRELVVGQDIEIPAGATRVESTLSVPSYFPWETYEFEVAEDGRLRPNLSFKGGTGSWGQPLNDVVPSVLIVTDGAADTAAFSQLTANGISLNNMFNVPAGPAAPQLPTASILPATRLPERWLDYTSVDLLCMSLDQLLAIKQQQPKRFREMRAWVAAGGNLLVHGVGTEWARLAELESLLQMPALGSSAEPGAVRGWALPDKKHYSRDLNQFGSAYSANQRMYYGAFPQQPQASVPAVAPTAPERAHFVTRPLELGMVTALTPDNPFPGTPEDWGWLLNTLGENRYMWYRRFGMSLQRENYDFWNWLIKGVGQAPVTPFRIMITVFVVVIGPLNYYWLWRRGKLHLLLILVPAFALLITGGLFAYAVVADGLGVQARVRSFTQIDQRLGQAVCWSRITYYAGLAPTNGLTFPQDVAVLPLESEGHDYQPGGLKVRTLDWTSEGQRLIDGWLSSRTPTQYVTVRSRPSRAGLRWIDGAAGAGPRLENQLGSPIKLLLICGRDGTWRRAEDVAQGAVAPLEKADLAKDLTPLRKLLRDQQPAVPEGFEPGQTSSSGFFRTRYRSWNMNASDEASQNTGRMETALARVLAITPDRTAPLGPGSYVAVVERSPEVALGLDDAQEKDSLHVVVGQW